MLNCW